MSMVTNVDNRIASEVCDPFLPNLIRYHCPIGKSMERCIHKHVYMYKFCIANNIITPFQSGFVRGDSITDQ